MEKKKNTATPVGALKKKSQRYLFPLLGVTLLHYLLLLLLRDVSGELLICSFICMVFHAPLARQACRP